MSDSKNIALVFGISGGIGSNIYNQLKKKNFKVFGVSRATENNSNILSEQYLKSLSLKLKEQNIKIKIIGNIAKFPVSLKRKLRKSEEATKKNTKIQINIALNYGSREEITNSMRKLKKLSLRINERNISKNLYTNNIPDPEILIRTGNTYRLSNFLLWQSSYTEIFFVKKLWPDFNKNDFNKILLKFSKIRRNFGGI